MSLIENTWKEGYKKGLEHALKMAELHKEFSHDIDYLLSTLKALIDKEDTKAKEVKDHK